MEVVRLPAQAERALRARQLKTTRNIFRIDPDDMADRVCGALDDLGLGSYGYAIVGTDILRMEAGEDPVPLPVACATAQVFDDGMTMLEELLESLREIRGEPSWPLPDQAEAG